MATLAFLEGAAELARRHGFLLASDEAYSELWFESGPPPSVLQVGDLTNVVAINTLEQAIVHDRVPLGIRGGRSAADRGHEGAAAVRRA